MAYQIIMIIQYVSIALLATESIYVFVNMKTKGQTYLFLYCFSTLINNISYMIVMTAQTSREALIGAQMCYVGKIWIPLSFVAMLNEICEIKFPKLIYQIAIGINVMILGMMLTCDKHYLYYTADREFVQTGLFPHNVYGHTWIYYAYMVVVLGYIVYSVVLLVRQCIVDKDKVRRSTYKYLIPAVIAMTLGYVAYMTRITNGYDTTVLGYAVSSLMLIMAIFKNRLMDTLSIARDYVIDTISEGVIVTDMNGKVIYYNQPMKQLYSDIDENVEGVIEEVIHQTDASKVIYKDDKVYEPMRTPLIRGNEEPRGQVYVLTDVTARYRYMQELREQKEIAETANASKSAFLSVVTHEIRTPMNAIVGMTDLILREPEHLSSKQEKYLQNIRTSGDSLVMIVNDILDQSKIEAGKMEIIEDAYELRPMIEDVKMIIENRIGSKPIHLIYEIEDDIPRYLIGDSLRIRQILINLMNNAVKFTEDGYIKLSVKCVEVDSGKRKLTFSVKDSGQGIKPEDLSKLGEAFAQVDTKKNHSKEGTGLGLSISKDFISMMGGQLEVKSEYGNGSEFFFSIWQGIASGIDMTGVSGVSKQAWQQEEQFTAPEAKILIVDDTQLNLIIAGELLRPLHMQIETATSGERAIEMVRENRYHVIFMDYMMPYMDGVETTEKIRAEALKHGDNYELNAYFKSVPIIALSGDDSEEAKEKFLRAGIDDFTVKPIELKRLKKLLLKWLPEELIVPEEAK